MKTSLPAFVPPRVDPAEPPQRPKKTPTAKQRIARAWKLANGRRPDPLRFEQPVPPFWRHVVGALLADRRAVGRRYTNRPYAGELVFPGTWRDLAEALGYARTSAGTLSRRMRRGWKVGCYVHMDAYASRDNFGEFFAAGTPYVKVLVYFPSAIPEA